MSSALRDPARSGVPWVGVSAPRSHPGSVDREPLEAIGASTTKAPVDSATERRIIPHRSGLTRPVESAERSQDEANLPAEPDQATAQARVSSPYEDPRGPGCAQETTFEGSETSDGLCGHEVGPAMLPPTGSFRRSERLLHSRDFQRVARYGIRVASPDFVLLVAPARPEREGHRGYAESQTRPLRRLGVTASRKLGGAVVRNRVKRRIREWFRNFRGDLEERVDIVVIARSGAAGLSGQDICEQLRKLALQAARTSHRDHRRTGALNG